MAIPVVCPACAARLRVSDDFLGRKTKCPRCANVFPAEEEVSTGDPPIAAPSYRGENESPGSAASVRGPRRADDVGRSVARRGHSSSGGSMKLWLIVGAVVVAGVGVGLLIILLAGDPTNPRVTKANWEKIKPGESTLADLEELLGQAKRGGEKALLKAADVPKGAKAGPIDVWDPINPPDCLYWQNGTDYIFVLMLGPHLAQAIWITNENDNRIMKVNLLHGVSFDFNLTEIKNQSKR